MKSDLIRPISSRLGSNGHWFARIHKACNTTASADAQFAPFSRQTVQPPVRKQHGTHDGSSLRPKPLRIRFVSKPSTDASDQRNHGARHRSSPPYRLSDSAGTNGSAQNASRIMSISRHRQPRNHHNGPMITSPVSRPPLQSDQTLDYRSDRRPNNWSNDGSRDRSSDRSNDKPNDKSGTEASSLFQGQHHMQDMSHNQAEKLPTSKLTDIIARYKAQNTSGSSTKPFLPNQDTGAEKAKRKQHSVKSREADETGRTYKKDYDDWARDKAMRKSFRQQYASKSTGTNPPSQSQPQVRLPCFISNANLAKLLDIRFSVFARKLQTLGFKNLSPEHLVNAEDAGLIAMEYGFDSRSQVPTNELVAAPWPADPAALPARPPVVTIMGHVDHGKTTILDFLRKSSLAAQEHGGITQHIGAFTVPLASGNTITFLDTPGHAAFLEMRQRGAIVTDIVVLVVAADDGVMPQTIEAIKHAKQAKVPLIVAVNKIDKPEANVERIKQDLARYQVEIEDFGGDVQVICVSGKTGQGMKDFEEAIMTLSEVLDHRAPQEGTVEGWILEASTKPHGRVATVLIRRGIIRPGTILVAGSAWARVKTLRDETDSLLESAAPGIAVEIDGWRDPPRAGDEALEAADEKQAAAVAKSRLAQIHTVKLADDMEAINQNRETHRIERQSAKAEANMPWWRLRHQKDGRLEGVFRENQNTGGPIDAFFLIKADVNGSAEAVVNLLSTLGDNQVRPHIIRSGVGPITENDVHLADAAHATILAFNLDTDADIRSEMSRRAIPLIEHSIIYRIVDDVNSVLEALLPEVVTQRVNGEAEIMQLFNITVKGSGIVPIAGCRVRNGSIIRANTVRILRDDKTVFDGRLATLKNVKKDVAEMKKDSECGMSFDGWTGFQVGDKIQSYVVTRDRPKLQPATR